MSTIQYGLALLALALVLQDSDGQSAPVRDSRENGEEVVEVESLAETFTEATTAVPLPVIGSLRGVGVGG